MRIQDRIVQAFRRNPSAATNRRRSPLKVAGLLGALLVTVLLVSACSKVPMPESDDSAPRLSWRVIDGLNGVPASMATTVENNQTNAIVGEMVIIQLTADDQEGVKRIKLSDPVLTYTCVTGDGEKVVEEEMNLILSYQEEILAPDAANEVFSELLLFDTVYFNHDCGVGLTLAEATASFYAEAENYFDGVSTAELILVHTP